MPLVLTLMLVTFLAALAAAVTTATTTEMAIAGTYRDTTALLYAADGASEYAIARLLHAEWDAVLGAPGSAPYVSGDLHDLVGEPSRGTGTTVTVWVSGLTDPDPAAPPESRLADIRATAYGPNGGRRSVAVVIRLTRSGEVRQFERLSWRP